MIERADRDQGVPRPVIGPGDGGLLRIEACGICGSDVEQYKGNLGGQWLPMVPGHEPLGIIEEASESACARWGVRPGDRQRKRSGKRGADAPTLFSFDEQLGVRTVDVARRHRAAAASAAAHAVR